MKASAKQSPKASQRLDFVSYAEFVLPHLGEVLERNQSVMQKVGSRLVTTVERGLSLLVAGSGHSSIFALELYHRAGGPSFVVPVVADHLLPTAGPSTVRILERTAGAANVALRQVDPVKGEMIWICSQSGMNAAIVELALESKRLGLYVVAFTSVSHSKDVKSRHASGKKLYEIADAVIDLGGIVGDAAIEIAPGVSAGPVSSMAAIFLAHSILVPVLSELEHAGVRCTYTSVNTAQGEDRNRTIEAQAARRDWRLR